MAREEEMIKERLKKLEEFRKSGINPYPNNYKKKDNAADLQGAYKKLKNEEFGKKTSVAGRIVAVRSFGKLVFMKLVDSSGEIQLVFISKKGNKESEEKVKDIVKWVDIGDIVGVEGKIFRTKRGELSVMAEEIKMLAKSIKPLPEKWHGLKDKEERYRKRYLDLIMNPKVKEVFIKRSEIVEIIREFLKKNEFVEVEVPNLQTIYGGASAKPFKTHLNALDMDLFLSVSPELYLKRLIVGGFERVFTICKNFRNEGIDREHNPEFTMLEFYCAYANYEELMKMTEKLFDWLKKKLKLGNEIGYQGKKINLKTPFKRVKFRDIIFKETGVDIDKENNFQKLKKAIASKKLKEIDIENCKHYGALLDELYKRIVRDTIIQPTFLTHYPVEMIALAKRNEENPRYINTFQLLIDGAEIVKAYDELNDPIDQEKRLKEQANLLKEGSEDAMPMDEDFINAIEIGMPPTGGLGLGIDRMVMLFTGQDSIRDVILFPFMKPEGKEDMKGG